MTHETQENAEQTITPTTTTAVETRAAESTDDLVARGCGRGPTRTSRGRPARQPPPAGARGPRLPRRGHPHVAAEDVVAHLRIPAGLRATTEHAYYEAGHMVYLHEPSRLRQGRDLADLVRRASGE